MPFTKGNKHGKGRPRGAKNKFGLSAREAFQRAFDGIGGYQALQEWATKGPLERQEFFRLYARLIPVEHAGPEGGPVQAIVKHIYGDTPPDK